MQILTDVDPQYMENSSQFLVIGPNASMKKQESRGEASKQRHVGEGLWNLGWRIRRMWKRNQMRRKMSQKKYIKN